MQITEEEQLRDLRPLQPRLLRGKAGRYAHCSASDVCAVQRGGLDPFIFAFVSGVCFVGLNGRFGR
jgi:hypothetical protein